MKNAYRTDPKIAGNFGHRKFIAEIDSLTTINLLCLDTNLNHPLFSLIQNCKRLNADEWLCDIVHVFREGNMLADSLARLGHGMEIGLLVFDDPLWFLEELWKLMLWVLPVSGVVLFPLLSFLLFWACALPYFDTEQSGYSLSGYDEIMAGPNFLKRSTRYQVRSLIEGELCGGQGGSDWDYFPESGIVEITVIYSDVIHSLHFKHAMENFTDKSSEKFGGCGGKNQQIIRIDWPNEYLTKISGAIGTLDKDEVIGTLSFTTNRNKKYGPFGSKIKDCDICKSSFELISEKNRAVVGFFGRQSNFIDAIGVYYKDPPAPIVTTKVISAITMNKDIPREVGPWGGNKGKAWDDGRLLGRIIEIDVHVGNGVVHALHYRYKSTKDCDLSNKHGGEGATTIYRIKLDNRSTDEYFTGISGYYWALDGNSCLECEYQVVRSITLYTNKATYGPFGEEIGTFFISPACDNAKLVGLHGRCGAYLDAIGVHVQYL
ncbi:hypothetical protein Dsin_014527 [Dipteronia sinensis]|uniref:Jacalin-type lectin domain-containing protein n=1 Tax=Dipteronia sinensis TaxID=43782 RepID=A0AAE0AN91_9ROSI|nr:hypothetical protein Dsin_014527 [Dipteronia sinensis]